MLRRPGAVTGAFLLAPQEFREFLVDAVLGGADSDEPLLLPMEAIELDASAVLTRTTPSSAGLCSAAAAAS
ncbi:hypothetical protein [Streptomyces sp. Ac-502]|uniref:hypothetical protein n=1 Tax=Streptomyces sp. Ac-502 TaxID=3342801 RepID=UPI003862B392